ncbi:MAG: caspase family protein [Candidatus Ozemobacteraceae bacterium]
MSTSYLQCYQNSWALVIGINEYQYVPKLYYACNDALAIVDCLKTQFAFPENNIIHLSDSQATKDGILTSYNTFTKDHVKPDDRVFIFFAGHGHTVTGKRGEVGYLVPCDGDISNLVTMIRWDDLTRNSDLILAKHFFLVVDACYGGLAVNRLIRPGNKRFLNDMLQRYARQVLSSGKEDQPVSDGNGPIPKHSIFTGHLLEALNGKAASSDGVLTANKIMAYVCQMVGCDNASQQTPHYGAIDGDGDFVFLPVMSKNELADSKNDDDTFYEPVSSLCVEENGGIADFQALVKTYLSDLKYRIQLDDLVTTTLRSFQKRMIKLYDEIKVSQPTPENFISALRRYENEIIDLQTLVVLLSKYGEKSHEPILKQIFVRTAEVNEISGGTILWLAIRWYPLYIFLCSGGISAISSNRFSNLHVITSTSCKNISAERKTVQIYQVIVDNFLDLKRAEIFRKIPGHEKFYTPISEYIYKTLQPPLEDLLFLGREYENLFDKFEVLLALIFADTSVSDGHQLWGPIGRFGYKFAGRDGRENPFQELLNEADRDKNEWAPLMAGYFDKKYERFLQISSGYAQILQKLNWF